MYMYVCNNTNKTTQVYMYHCIIHAYIVYIKHCN